MVVALGFLLGAGCSRAVVKSAKIIKSAGKVGSRLSSEDQPKKRLSGVKRAAVPPVVEMTRTPLQRLVPGEDLVVATDAVLLDSDLELADRKGDAVAGDQLRARAREAAKSLVVSALDAALMRDQAKSETAGEFEAALRHEFGQIAAMRDDVDFDDKTGRLCIVMKRLQPSKEPVRAIFDAGDIASRLSGRTCVYIHGDRQVRLSVKTVK